MKTITLEPEHDAQIHDIATRHQIEHAITTLSDGDKKRLMTIAKMWCRYFGLPTSIMPPEDLFQEALVRMLKPEKEHPRRWPYKTVSFVKFVDYTMKSIAGHLVEQRCIEAEIIGEMRPPEELPVREGLTKPMPLKFDGIDDQLDAQNEIDEIKEFFGENTIEYMAVYYKGLGMTGEEIKVKLDLTSRKWEAVKKDIQRKFVKYGKGNQEEV